MRRPRSRTAGSTYEPRRPCTRSDRTRTGYNPRPLPVRHHVETEFLMAITASKLAELTATFSGPLVGPDAADYDQVRAIHNALVDKRPALIARCRGVADIAAAVKFGRENGLTVAV